MQAGGQPCNFAAHRVAMHRAAADRLVQHLGGRLGQRAGTCPDDAVALGALDALPMTLLGRWMNWNMRHNQSFLTVRAPRSNTPVQFIASMPGRWCAPQLSPRSTGRRFRTASSL